MDKLYLHDFYYGNNVCQGDLVSNDEGFLLEEFLLKHLQALCKVLHCRIHFLFRHLCTSYNGKYGLTGRTNQNKNFAAFYFFIR